MVGLGPIVCLGLVIPLVPSVCLVALKEYFPFVQGELRYILSSSGEKLGSLYRDELICDNT